MRLSRLRPINALIPLVFAPVLVVLATGPGPLAGEASWPQEFKVDETRIVFYEPQFEALEQDLLKGRAAVAITPKGRTSPIFGAAWIESQVAIDRDARTVRAKATKVTRVHLPDSTPEDEVRLQERLSRVVPDLDLTVSLDRLTTALDASSKERQAALDLNMTPPRIRFETEPAFLVVLDGPPKTIRVQEMALERVVNTPSFIVRDTGTSRHYLRGAGRWYEASEIAGPWRAIAEPPDAVTKLWEKGASRDLKSADEVADDPAPATREGKPPRVIVSSEPAELIVSDGEPEFAPISGLDLLYMSNTFGDVLLEVGTQTYYVLLSGRWFRSQSLQGPWGHVRPDMLPESFASIPPGSPKGDVLASVAGTSQAEEAVLDSAVPQTAVVRKSQATLTVTYDGDPTFRPIPKTKVEYAVNTDSQVMRIRGRFYAVDQGVWFVSDSPTGPWAVADEEPPEAQEIPPDSPVYNTKYVYVYEATPDRVYVGYLPGYLGYYPYYGTVVYGTGWYYPGWWGSAYYPYPATWGFGAHYSTWAGWSFGFGIGFGYGWYPYSAWYPWGYAGWWGPVGWGPCYAHYGYPYYGYPYYGRVATVGSVPPSRPPRGSNTNLYRLPENVTRVAQTRDKYAARIGSGNRSHGQGRLSSNPSGTGRPTSTGRPATLGRPAPRPDVTHQTPRQVGRSRTAPAPPSRMTRPSTPGRHPSPSVRPAPSGRPSSSSRPAPSVRTAPSARRPHAAPPARSSPPTVRSAPRPSRPSVPSFGGGSRSFGGGRSMSQGHRGSSGGGMSAPRGGHRRR